MPAHSKDSNYNVILEVNQNKHFCFVLPTSNLQWNEAKFSKSFMNMILGIYFRYIYSSNNRSSIKNYVINVIE